MLCNVMLCYVMYCMYVCMYIYIIYVCVCLVVCFVGSFFCKRNFCVTAGSCQVFVWSLTPEMKGVLHPGVYFWFCFSAVRHWGLPRIRSLRSSFCWACICFLGTLLVVQATGKTHTAAMAKYQSLQPQSWEPNIWIAWKVCVLVSLLRRVPSRCFSYCRWGVFAHLHQVDTRHRFPQDVSSKPCVLPTNIWRSRTCWCFTKRTASLVYPCKRKTCCKTSSLNLHRIVNFLQQLKETQIPSAFTRFQALGWDSAPWGWAGLASLCCFSVVQSLLLAARRSPS